MLLRRFAYPCCYSDMISRFGRPVPVLSMVTNTVQGPVSQKSRKLFGPEKPFVKLSTACSGKPIF